jgi:hypothetical protein
VYSATDPTSVSPKVSSRRCLLIITPFQTETQSSRRFGVSGDTGLASQTNKHLLSAATPPPSSPDHSSSPSSSDSDYRHPHRAPMAPSNRTSRTETHVEQDGLNHILILTEGDPSPEVIQEFGNGCLDYFGCKEIKEEKQTAKILPGFKDLRIRAHINANCA